MDNAGGSATAPTPLVVEIRGLDYAYGATTTLSGLDATLQLGDLVAIVGPSGAGKSTLLRLLGGLLQPTAGSITIGTHAAATARKHKQIAFVPQHPALMEWRTAAENVQLSLEINPKPGDRSARVQQALADVGMVAYADRFPRELSGGQQQRVALARALVLQAPILLLDEPFSSADELTKRALYDVVKQSVLEGKQMAVLVTHSLDEAIANATRILVLGGKPARFLGEMRLDNLASRMEAIENGTFRGMSPALFALLERASRVSTDLPDSPDSTKAKVGMAL